MQCVKFILRISRAGPLADRLDHEDKNEILDHDMHKKTDEELEEIVKERIETLYHPTSTCRMAPLEEGGVVDSQLRVYGVKGCEYAMLQCFLTLFLDIQQGLYLPLPRKQQILSKRNILWGGRRRFASQSLSIIDCMYTLSWSLVLQSMVDMDFIGICIVPCHQK